MSKKDPKSNEKFSAIEEPALKRMRIHAMCYQINQNLDTMLDQLNRLIPAEDTNRCIKHKTWIWLAIIRIRRE